MSFLFLASYSQGIRAQIKMAVRFKTARGKPGHLGTSDCPRERPVKLGMTA